jgi:hypothetical protein
MLGRFAIRTHPLAPHFEDPQKAGLYFRQIFSELQSPNLNLNREATELTRELGFCSLWFFLSCILGPFGPYDKLHDPLSIDMCNFRGSDSWMLPGAHAAAFIPRGFYKSTMFTHGGTTWDLLRNPNERAVIVNAISDKAQEFFHQVQRNFDSNELMAALYPEWIVGKKGKATDKELILPNRKGSSVEPSLRYLGLTGAAEGGHYSLITIDDLVGLDSLDQNRQSNAQMETAKKWFRTNRRALRLDRHSRIGVVATRYALDDCYEDIYKSVRHVEGWQEGDLQIKADGEWDVYYRLHEENGTYLRPDIMDRKGFEQLLKDDFWSAMTQYMNAPTKAGMSEFASSFVGEAELIWVEDEWWIKRLLDPNWTSEGDEEVAVRLADCDVIVTSDLAATEKRMSARTCRSSIAVWATDSRGNRYRIWSRVGYFAIDKSIGFFFEANAKFRGYIRTTIVEGNAFQKIVKPVLNREMEIRKDFFGVTVVNAGGDKKARIRAALGQTLPRKQIWLVRGEGAEFLEELRLFPMSDNRLDTLDESEKAITFGVRPTSSEERAIEAEREEERTNWEGGAVGY